MRRLQTIQLCLPLLIIAALTPETAHALQSHGPPEGIYVHQMAHILFFTALIYLYWHTRKTPALSSKGWRYLRIFCLLFAGWNILALLGHELFELLTPEDFLGKASWKEALAPPISFVKVAYFITKMDHLLYVPALFALVISLRTFCRESMEDHK